MTDTIPRLRNDIEVTATVYQGNEAFMIGDSLGLIESPVLIQGPGLAFIRLIDGLRSERDLQVEIIRAGRNVYISLETVREWLAELDRAYLLESPRFRAARDRLIDDYAKKEIREAHLAGKAYPEESGDLRAYLADRLSVERTTGGRNSARVRALAAPHIDLETGKAVYASAYGSLSGSDAPRRVLALGTGHSLQGYTFSVSGKAFSTPLGTIEADRNCIDAVRNTGSPALSPSDICHRREHSLEFQLIFLQSLFGTDFVWVPVLCGSMQQELDECGRPSEIPGVGEILEILRAYAEDPGTLIVAGVDFSHIGLKFGDSFPARELLEEAGRHDQRLLSALGAGDVLGFWKESRRVKDRFNVCGFSALAVLLEILPPCRGELLGYQVWEEQATQSAVSYAAMSFYQEQES